MQISNGLQVLGDPLRGSFFGIDLEENDMGIDPPIVIDTMDVSAMALDYLRRVMKGAGIIRHASDEGEGLHALGRGLLYFNCFLKFTSN